MSVAKAIQRDYEARTLRREAALGGEGGRVLVFVHLYSGPRRIGDRQDDIEN